MSELQCVARLKIHDGKIDEFKRLAAILQTCSGSGEVCGTLSPELIERLKDSPVQVYTPQPG
jgi:hypothetical protein